MFSQSRSPLSSFPQSSTASIPLSTQPPSYASFQVTPSENSSIRTVSPLPTGDLEAQYLYYCLHQDGGRIHTNQSYGSSDESLNGDIGRLNTNALSPPRNIKGLKRYIARLEGFSGADIEEIFLTNEANEGEPDATRLDLSPNAPGRDPTTPIHVTLLDNAARAPSGKHSGSTEPSGSSSAVALPPAASNILIHRNAIWNVDASGFAEPACAPGNSSQISGAREPPGWMGAHIKTDSGHAFELRMAEGPNAKWYQVWKKDYFLVDRRRTIKDSEGRRFYRAIFVKIGIIVYLNAKSVEFNVT
ncbi:hypothetical protein DL93DRAFT_2155938 [Clavulina sp. PMI_390]|nr:hypothetical protein DL93DRAFT_2155938 [Clavulina sp. PMI_390]